MTASVIRLNAHPFTNTCAIGRWHGDVVLCPVQQVLLNATAHVVLLTHTKKVTRKKHHATNKIQQSRPKASTKSRNIRQTFHLIHMLRAAYMMELQVLRATETNPGKCGKLPTPLRCNATSKSMALNKAGFLNCFQMKNMCHLPSQPTGGLWKWKMVEQ
jgi:hypothetical protein